MNLDNFSIDELRVLREKLNVELVRRRKELARWLELLESSLSEKPRRGPPKGSKAAIKYIGPDGETWTGRGLRPRWLKDLLNQGFQIEKFSAQ